MKKAGLAVELLETRHASDAFKAMPVKSDRNDARNIAQLMRLGWFRPHPASNVRDDRDTPLQWRRDGERIIMDFGKMEEKYFCRRGLT